MARNIYRFKREITIKSIESENKKRVRLDPKVSYIRKLKSKVDIVNKMLKALEEKGYDDIWAGKKLHDTLSQQNIDILTGNRIDKRKLTKSRSMTNLTAIEIRLNDFIDNKTSTVSGINKRTKSYRDTIANYTDSRDFANSLSEEEVFQFYEIFDDPNYKTIAERIDPSDLYVLAINTYKDGTSKKDFIEQLAQRGYDVNDIELGLAISSLHDKLMSFRNE